jgi:hypothetical protein
MLPLLVITQPEADQRINIKDEAGKNIEDKGRDANGSIYKTTFN